MIVHSLLGNFFGYWFSSAWILLGLGILSHLILDSIPHWDGPFNRKEFIENGKAKIEKLNIFIRTIDVVLVILSLILIYHWFDSEAMLLGAIFALTPDLIKAGYVLGLKNNRYFLKQLKFHAKIQKDAGWKIGLIVQILIVVFVIISLLLIKIG